MKWVMRRRRQAAPRPAIGAYAHRAWPRRHRWLFFGLLILFAVLYGFSIAIFSQVLLVQLAAPLLVLAGLALWVAPDMDWAPENALSGLLSAYVVALFCWPDYMAIAIPGLPWITVLRLVGVPLTITLLLCVSLSADFRGRLAAVLAAEPWIWRLVAAFVLIAFLSIGLSKEVFQSLNRFVVAQLNWTVPYLVAAIVFVRPGRVRRLSAYLWATAMFNCVLGVWEAHIRKVPWAGHIPSFLKIEDETVLRTLGGNYRAYTDMYRITTRFGVPLTLGEFLGFATPFLLHMMWTTGNRMVRWGVVASLPVIFYVVLQTGSRLGFICFAASLILYGVAATYLWWRSRPDGIVPAAILFGYPAGLMVFVLMSFVWRRLETLIWGDGSAQSSTDARQEMYQSGIQMVLHQPFGHGIGQGAVTLGYHTPGGILTIDTYYLSVALEVGVAGFLVYYGVFAYAMGRSAWLGLRSRDPEIQYLIPVSIALLNFIISKSVLAQQENHPLVFMMLGIVAALSWRNMRDTGTVVVAPRPITARRLRMQPRLTDGRSI